MDSGDRMYPTALLLFIGVLSLQVSKDLSVVQGEKTSQENAIVTPTSTTTSFPILNNSSFNSFHNTSIKNQVPPTSPWPRPSPSQSSAPKVQQLANQSTSTFPDTSTTPTPTTPHSIPRTPSLFHNNSFIFSTISPLKNPGDDASKSTQNQLKNSPPLTNNKHIDDASIGAANKPQLPKVNTPSPAKAFLPNLRSNHSGENIVNNDSNAIKLASGAILLTEPNTTESRSHSSSILVDNVPLSHFPPNASEYSPIYEEDKWQENNNTDPSLKNEESSDENKPSLKSLVNVKHQVVGLNNTVDDKNGTEYVSLRRDFNETSSSSSPDNETFSTYESGDLEANSSLTSNVSASYGDYSDEEGDDDDSSDYGSYYYPDDVEKSSSSRDWAYDESSDGDYDYEYEDDDYREYEGSDDGKQLEDRRPGEDNYYRGSEMTDDQWIRERSKMDMNEAASHPGQEVFVGPHSFEAEFGPISSEVRSETMEMHQPFVPESSHDASLGILVFYTWIGIVTVMVIGAFITLKHRHRIVNALDRVRATGYYRRRRAVAATRTVLATRFAMEEGQNLLTHQHV